MLIAHKAVDNKIKSVKSSIGNTITITPAGFNPGSQVNNALTTTQLAKVSAIAHISSVTESLSDRLSTTGSTTSNFGPFGNPSSSNSTTSLTSPTTINFDRNRSGSGDGYHVFTGGGTNSLPSNFTPPITFLGTNRPTTIEGDSLKITSGSAVDANTDNNDVLISQAMATKNSSSVGSTFTAYNATLTVKGIFTSSTRAADDTVVLSLPTLQRLSGQSGAVTNATVTVDSLDNLSSVTAAIKNTLGSSADVVSAQEQADNTIKPLNSVKAVSSFSLIGAIVAGAIIILLTMVMIVRERKREIGVVKAIGGSNLRIMGEFIVESLTLAVLGMVIGLLIGTIGGQPVTKMLVNNSSDTASSQVGPASIRNFADRPAAPADGFGRGFRNNATVRSLSNIKTQIGWGILLDGFGAAVLISVLGSALAAGLIAKVRPSEVMRSI